MTSSPPTLKIVKGDPFALSFVASNHYSRDAYRILEVDTVDGTLLLKGDVVSIFAEGVRFEVRGNTLPDANQVFTVEAVELGDDEATTLVTITGTLPTGTTASGQARRLDDPPRDLTGYTVASQIRTENNSSGTLIVELTAEIDDDPTTGRVHLSLTAEETAEIESQRGYWDARLVASDESVIRIPNPPGMVLFAEGVTVGGAE